MDALSFSDALTAEAERDPYLPASELYAAVRTCDDATSKLTFDEVFPSWDRPAHERFCTARALRRATDLLSAAHRTEPSK